MKTNELMNHLNDLLKPNRFRDYTINGLQIEGAPKINKIITAVSASKKAIEFAISQNAEALLVHHGYFWKGEPAELIGIKRQRIAQLLQANINLIAYHLPLDQHERFGNNPLFAHHFECLKVWQSEIEPLIWHAEIVPVTQEALLSHLSASLQRPVQAVGVGRAVITRVAWCTGAAQDYLQQAVREGAEVFISGEYAERTYHEAHELEALYVSCGHHASERAGVKYLGEYLAQQFNLEVIFFDEGNPF